MIIVCSCTNSRTGEAKKKYATKSLANEACADFRKKVPDGYSLNSYQCPEGKWWHVGNSSWDDRDDFDEGKTHYPMGSKSSTATIEETVGARAARQSQMRAREIANARKPDLSYQPPIAQEANNGFLGCLLLVVIIVVVICMFSC
jgi:hypothetical protein